MPTIPLWAIGKHITSILLTPQSVNTTTGALTDTTPTAQFFGTLQDIDVADEFETENLSAMDRPYKNLVPIESGQTLKLTEYEKSAGTSLAASVAFGGAGSYWKYTVTRGVNSFVGYGVLIRYNMSGTKPKVMAQLELGPIDPGSTVALTYS